MNDNIRNIIDICNETGVKLQTLSVQMNTALIEFKDGKQLYCSFDMLKQLELTQSQIINDGHNDILEIINTCDKMSLFIETINNIDNILVLKTMQGKTILCDFNELPYLYNQL